ncbi:MAG: FeoB-associated Cys-rich membrane protein [Lachnospiraceae bacterium]|jgi:hypothetical protein
MADLVLFGVVAVIVGTAAAYIVKAKKRGVTCIGCPLKSHSGCSCGCHTKTGR